MARRKKSKAPFIISGVLIALAAILALLLFFMFHNANNLDAAPNNDNSGKSEQVDDHGFVYVDWDYWLSINPDIIGWVNVPDTVISYPIVAADPDDPDYYLHHDVYKNYNIYGVPYLDAECVETGLMDSYNGIIYGHHMNDGTMFAAFADYSDKPYAKKHSRICLQTPDLRYWMETRFVDVVYGSKLAKHTSFSSLADHRTWYEKQRADADVVLDKKSTPIYLDTFCTCSYLFSNNERTLVYSSIDEVFPQLDHDPIEDKDKNSK